MTGTAGRTASMTVRNGQLLLKGNDKTAALDVVSDDVSGPCQSPPTGISYLTAVQFLALLETSKEPFETVFARLLDEVKAIERRRCVEVLKEIRATLGLDAKVAYSALTSAINVVTALK